MATISCPTCQSEFDSAASGACPACGWRVAPAAPVVAARPVSARPISNDPPPARAASRRRDDDEDLDIDPDRPRRKPTKKKSSGMLLPIAIIGGALFVLIMVAGVGVGAYMLMSSKPAPPPNGKFVTANAPPPPMMAPQQFPPQPAPQPGNPAMPAVPGIEFPPNFPGLDGPGAGGEQPAAPATVVLSNLRKVQGFAGKEELEVTYEYTQGEFNFAQDVLIVESASGTSTVRITPFGPPQKKNTVQISSFGFNMVKGPVKVWMERGGGVGPFGGRGTKISNEVTLAN